MKIEPRGEWILVRPEGREGTTAGGLVIPANATKPAVRGEVLAVGPGERCDHCGRRTAPDVRAGDTVVWTEFNVGQGLKDVADLDGEMLIPCSQVIAVVGR